MTLRAFSAIGTVLLSITACSVRGTDIKAVPPKPAEAFESARCIAGWTGWSRS